jgi:hypothetical protein
MRWTSLLSIFASLALAKAGSVIVPGATWTDTSGNVIQAHGGGILKVGILSDREFSKLTHAQVGSTYYWHGEDKTANSALFHAVSCYTVSTQRQLSCVTG